MGSLGSLISTGLKALRSDSIRGNAAKIFSLQLAALGVSMLSSVLIARALGPSGKGIVDLFSVLQSFIVEIGLLGFGSGLLYHLANQGRPLSAVHGTGLASVVGLGLITIALGFAALPLWRQLFRDLPSWMILSAFSLSPALYYLVVWNNIQNGINKPVMIQKMGMLVGGTNLAGVVILFAYHKLSPETMVAQLILISLLNGLISFVLLFRKEPRLRLDWSLASASFKRGFYIYCGFVANILHFRVDQIMINSMLGTRELGLYSLSVKFAEMLFLLDTALISSALYRISSAPKAESHVLTGRVFRKQLLISGGSGLVLMAAAYPLIRILYGKEFLGSVTPLILLVPGVLSWSVAKVLSQFVTFNLGRFGLVTTFAVIGLAANVALNFVLIPRLGINGAALSSSLSYGAMLVLTYFAYRRFA